MQATSSASVLMTARPLQVTCRTAYALILMVLLLQTAIKVRALCEKCTR